MLAKYGDRVLFRVQAVPASIHPYSMEAAIAASCANEEGKYWEYRAALFAQPVLTCMPNGRRGIQTSRTSSTSRVSTPATRQEVRRQFMQQTLKEGQDCGIYGTPTFFVNGKAFVGRMQETRRRRR